MKNKRYSVKCDEINSYSIIDNEEVKEGQIPLVNGGILVFDLFKSDADIIVTRLNRQDAIIKQQRKHLDAMISQLQQEIDNSEGELKKALIRISKKKN
jgi:hypothetical protein